MTSIHFLSDADAMKSTVGVHIPSMQAWHPGKICCFPKSTCTWCAHHSLTVIGIANTADQQQDDLEHTGVSKPVL